MPPTCNSQTGMTVCLSGRCRWSRSLSVEFQNEVFKFWFLTPDYNSEVEVDRDVFRIYLCQLLKSLKSGRPARFARGAQCLGKARVVRMVDDLGFSPGYLPNRDGLLFSFNPDHT